MHLRALLVGCAHSCLSSSEHTSACATQYNREGSSAVFLYHIGRCKSTVAGGAPAWTFVFTVRADGGGLWRLPVRRSAARMQLPSTAGKAHTSAVPVGGMLACYEGLFDPFKAMPPPGGGGGAARLWAERAAAGVRRHRLLRGAGAAGGAPPGAAQVRCGSVTAH